MWHCEQRGFDKDLFIFFPEIDLKWYCEQNLLTSALFDHNALDPNQLALSSSVTRIMDHHEDRGLYPDAIRDVRVCGSACSMGINFYFDNNLQHLLTPEVTFFFVPAVIVDTVFLNPKMEGSKWN